jgi:MerR family regulatory protein
MDELTIGKLAKQANVHVETLRYYERRAMIPKPRRTVANYWLYSRESSAGEVYQASPGPRVFFERD